MQTPDNNGKKDPLDIFQEQIQTKQPSEKPANDVLDASESTGIPENRFVHTTHEELYDEPERDEAASAGIDDNEATKNMPDSEHVTEKD